MKIPFRITQLFIHEHPEIAFLFSGSFKTNAFAGGQESIFSGYPNCFKIVTRLFPCIKPEPTSYIYDIDIFLPGLRRAVAEAESYAAEKQGWVIPVRGMGQGCAKLKDTCPSALAELKELYIRFPYEIDYKFTL